MPISQGLPRPQNHTGQTLSGAKTATAARRCQERLIWSPAGPAKGCPGPPSGPPSSTGAPPVLLQRSCPPPPSETPPPPAPALYPLVLCRHEATVHPHESRDSQLGHCGAPAAVGTRGALLKAGQGEVRPLGLRCSRSFSLSPSTSTDFSRISLACLERRLAPPASRITRKTSCCLSPSLSPSLGASPATRPGVLSPTPLQLPPSCPARRRTPEPASWSLVLRPPRAAWS